MMIGYFSSSKKGKHTNVLSELILPHSESENKYVFVRAFSCFATYDKPIKSPKFLGLYYKYR